MRTTPVPLLRNVSGVMVSFPAPPSMRGAFDFTFPPTAPSIPQCQFHFLLVFMKFAMTFHLGGLNMKTLHFWRWGGRWPLAGADLSGRGQSMCNTEPSLSWHRPLHSTPSPEAPTELPAGALQETLPSLGGAERGPFLPHPRDRSWRSSLARRQGVSETAGAQVVFAKHLINRPGIVPTSHTVFQPASLHLES